MGTRNSRGSAGLTEEKMSSVWRAESLRCWWAFLVQMAARLLEGQWFKLSDLMGGKPSAQIRNYILKREVSRKNEWK